MRLSDVLVRGATVYEIKATTKEPALREMLDALAEADGLGGADKEAVLEALLRRERLGTTGVGKGIGVPHAKHESVKGIVAAIGHSHAGISYASLDNEPVHTVFLLVASPESTGEHLAALERISAIVRDDDYWRFLRDAKSAEEMLDVVAEADAGFEE